MPNRSLGHRAPLLWLAVPFAAGLVAGKSFPQLPLCSLAWIALALSVATLVATWNLPAPWSRGLLIGSMLAAGIFSYLLHDPRLGRWESAPPREVRVVLRVDRIFPRAVTMRVAGVGTIISAEAPSADLSGYRAYFQVNVPPGVPLPLRSAEIKIAAVVTVVARNSEIDSFDGYLLSAGIHFRLGRARLLATTKPPNAYRRWLDRAAGHLDLILRTGIPTSADALGHVYRAMMLGKKYELSEEQDTLFVQTGTMHLFAINGLHVGVVALALRALWTLLRIPRPLAALLTLSVLWLDVQTTGGSPSAVRAFILIACYEAAFVFRLRASALSALSAAALSVLLLDPFALFSASFQMSYGAVLAILLYGVPLAEKWETAWSPFRWLPKSSWTTWQKWLAAVWRKLAAAACIGLAAALAGAITATQFYHTLAPGGLVANLVFVPLATLAIIAGFISVLAGCAGMLPISGFFNRAALVVLWTVDRLTRGLVKIPAMWWPAHWRAAWLAALSFAILLAIFCLGYSQHWRKSMGGYWTPVAFVVVALLCGVRFG